MYTLPFHHHSKKKKKRKKAKAKRKPTQTQIQFSFNAETETKGIKGPVQPQTEACTPKVLFEPQTPLPFPHPSPTLAEGSLEEALAA
jgi:hypothetical protein